MFDNLLESKRKKERTLGGGLFSIVFHTGMIGAAIVATKQGVQAAIEQREEKVTLIEQKEKPPEPEKKPPPPDVVVNTPPPPKGFQILTAPVDIPDVLPEIDLSKKMTDEADFTGKGVAGGTSKGVVGGVPKALNTETTYYDFQVEKVAAMMPGSAPPVYPEMLKNGGIEGSVLASFIIDTTGRADMASFKAITSTHAQFTEAVRKALREMRFFPAEVGGHKVKQLVQQPFQFTLK